ncbi:MAG: hypothetical protein K6B28_07660 [Lachnospiraceae bacterium]|nr:hypothetical protein [Lachnospiraceae bacterium]
MANLRDAIGIMIEHIDDYCYMLATERRQAAYSYRNDMALDFRSVISAMLPLYDKPEHADVREDKDYWIAQYDRICQALSSDDSFFTIDVLKNETSVNFKLYLKMIDKGK